MQTTIKIKKIYRNEGVSSKGKQWKSVKLLDTNRAYYISFNPAILPQALTEGGTAKIEYENGDRAGSYKLTRIIEYADAVPSMKTTAMTGQGNSDASDRLPAPVAAAETMQATVAKTLKERLEIAAKAVEDQVPGASNFDAYNFLLAEAMANIRSEVWIAFEKWKIAKGVR